MVNYSSFESILEGLQQGNRFALAKAITLAESKLAEDHALARQLIIAALEFTPKSIRIGISGSPGVGKSTFIEALGMKYISNGHKVAVLAVDPSSSIHSGSILGDKTRMNLLGNQENAFIRPSPSGTHLGGVQQKTRDSILLCEAAGFDVVIIETVGVGQSEIAVSRMTDLFLLLIQPASGDELQGIKRGIVEMADMVIINKADEDRMASAKISKAAYLQALHLFPIKKNGASVPVVLCSAVSKE
jgi:LAO/AO transport system kinase